MPLKKDKAILINSIIGASVGILLNILLVPYWGSIGSSIVWLLSEIAVLCSAQSFVKKYLLLSFPFKSLLRNIVYMLPLVVFVMICNFYIKSLLLSLFIGAGVVCIYSLIIQSLVDLLFIMILPFPGLHIINKVQQSLSM